MIRPIRGAKGERRDRKRGGDGGSASSTNTLRSKARARIVDLLGEGEIEGLVNGAKSIYFDETPIQDAATGTYNFEGVTFDTRTGLPDQSYLRGAATVETPVSVEVRVKEATSPPVRTIIDADADAVRVIIRLPALVNSNRENNGELEATDVSYAIDVRAEGDDWVQMVLAEIVNEKTTSPYQRAHRIELPDGGAPWDLRVRRITADSEIVELQNETWWESYFVITEGKFTYPNSAVVALEVDAELFGNTLAARHYHVKGLKVAIPSNYDPVARTYDGIWDGTFITAWTSNPAWVLNDLIVNDRYGLGEFVDQITVDKWGLYQIAQYCDVMVASGQKDEDDEDILEPRFSYDGVINSREEAFIVLRRIATAFRGIAYWSLNQVVATADMPADPVKLITPANVLTGMIHYGGSGQRARHTVALVQWNDPADFDRPAIEVVIDDEALARFGWKETTVQTSGCRSRGMATRYGRWTLLTEKYENETATFEVSFDNADLRPGQIVAIADPAKGGMRHGGRLAAVSVSGLALTLDKAFTPTLAETYSIMVMLPDGTVETKAVTFSGGNLIATVATPFTIDPVPEAVWAITGSDITPRLFRVLNVTEPEKNVFRVTSVFHYAGKEAEVEGGFILSPLPYTRPRNSIPAPTALAVQESQFFQGGLPKTKVTLSWRMPSDFMASHFHLWATSPRRGLLDYGVIGSMAHEIFDIEPGRWKFFVTAVNRAGLVSPVLEQEHEAVGWEGVDPPYVSHLEIFGRGNSHQFGGRNCRIVWRNNFPGSTYDYGTESAGAGSGLVNPFYRDNMVRIYDPDTNELMRQEPVSGETYTYTFEHNAEDSADLGHAPLRRFRVEITVRDNLGRESDPVTMIVNNPVPAAVTPTVVQGMDIIAVSYEIPQDIDFAGGLIWMDEDPDFDPLEVEPVYDGANNYVTLAVDPFVTYYVRVAAYDSFGTTALNISTPIEIEAGSAENDTSAPSIPTTLALAASILQNPAGDLQSLLTATWDVSPSANFGNFEVSIRPAAGNWVSFITTENRFEWRGLLFNTTYEVKVRAFSKNGYPSGYTTGVSQLIPLNTVNPGAPTSLAAAASLRSVFLSWINPSDLDLGEIQIWSSTTNNRLVASLIGTAKGRAFTHSGLVTLVTRYYWIRAVNTSGLTGAWSNGDTAGVSVTPGEVEEGDIAADSINADHIQAHVITGDHISVTADLAPTITVNGTGISLGDMTDPADLVNSLTTVIQPGKIQISGATTLSDWRQGGDTTKIAGGQISANTIAANTVVVGLRGIEIAGLQFEVNKATNVLSWTSGVIYYTDDAGASASASITSGSDTWASGVRYIYWVKGATTVSDSPSRPIGSNDVILAIYRGGSDLVVNYGRTVIHGDHIITGTIIAAHIAALSITTAKIAAGAITANELAADSVTAVKILAGEITATHLAINSITAVKIVAGAIETAKIAVGGVETDRVASNAITNLASALTTGTIDTNDSAVMKEVQTVTITRTAGTSLDIDFGYDMSSYILNAPLKGYLYLLANGSQIFSINLNSPLCEITGFDSFGGPVSWNFTDTVSRSGSITYSLELRFYHDGSDYDPVTVRNRYIKGVEFKR